MNKEFAFSCLNHPLSLSLPLRLKNSTLLALDRPWTKVLSKAEIFHGKISFCRGVSL